MPCKLEHQAQAEEALLNASVLETPLCAAVLLEVSANRCREAGRVRRAAFRLIQVKRKRAVQLVIGVTDLWACAHLRVDVGPSSPYLPVPQGFSTFRGRQGGGGRAAEEAFTGVGRA